jgi:hypothetical protein
MDPMLFPDEALALLRATRYDPQARRGFVRLPCDFNWSDEMLSPARQACAKHGSRADCYQHRSLDAVEDAYQEAVQNVGL